jgi:cytochrome c oxidase subunit 4
MSDPANLKIYRNVLVALAILTVVTVGASRIDMGGGNIPVGLLIAVVKASLVVLFFMHLKYEKKWWLGLVLFPLALVMIIIFSNLPDTALNGVEGGESVSKPKVVIEHPGREKPHLGGKH